MPKPSNPPTPTGTFSDLYEAMQKRRTGDDQPPAADTQTSRPLDIKTSRRPDTEASSTPTDATVRIDRRVGTRSPGRTPVYATD